MKNLIYIKFYNSFTGNSWFILSDKLGEPFTDIEMAKKYARMELNGIYWGLAEHDQMLLNNAQIDNF